MKAILMMFNKISKYPFLILILIFSGCSKKEADQEKREYAESITFGRFISPGCFDSEFCVEIFRIDAKGLEEDVNDQFPDNSGFYNGNFATKLSQADYNAIESIFRTSIPDELLATNSGYLGSFPSWNTNNYYFEYKSSALHKFWIIDGSFDGSLGTNMQNFIERIQECINIASN